MTRHVRSNRIHAVSLLLTHRTPANVREGLIAVPTKAVKQWVAENLGTTLATKRATAYKKFAKGSG